MEPQDFVGRLLHAHHDLILPRGHYVADGEYFRFLQGHLDGGISPLMLVACGAVTVVPKAEEAKYAPRVGKGKPGKADAPTEDLAVISVDKGGASDDTDTSP